MPLAVPEEKRHRTKQAFVYHALRDAIMRCDLPPGERLVIQDLASRLSVSAIPVREALQTLQSEGLVVTVPHVGTTVAPIPPESIREVFTILEGLEIVSSRAAAGRATEADVERLSALVGTMDQAAGTERYEEWAELNTRFHLELARLGAMPLLEEMMERVLRRWDRVRRFYFSGVLIHRLEQAQQEHRAIVAALKRKDLEGLEAQVREHSRGALTSYLDYLERKASSS